MREQRRNREADQRLGFRNTNSTIRLLPEYEISSLQPSSVDVQPSLCRIWLVTPKKNIKMSSFKSSENIQKKEGGPGRSVSDNQSSSVTLNELAMRARKYTVISSFSKEVIQVFSRRSSYITNPCVTRMIIHVPLDRYLIRIKPQHMSSECYIMVYYKDTTLSIFQV